MNKWLKLGTLAAALAVVAVVAVLALGASAFAKSSTAQGSTAQSPAAQVTPPAYGPGFGRGMGPLGGSNWGGPQNSLIAVAAKVLGMSQADLVAALNNNKTIADIAKEKGVATSKIVDAFLAAHEAALKSAVDAKSLTQAQADQLLATMKTNVTALLNNTWTSHGPGMGSGFMGFVDANH